MNQYGYASLSQFQIMLWTFVVGCSAVYVMVLTGRLINIEATMLTLLGVAGFSNVLVATKPTGESQDTAQTTQAPQTNAAPVQPGGVVDLQVCGQPGDTRVMLAWKPPVTDGTPVSYLVQYRDRASVNSAWITEINSATETIFTITGLVANTSYDFQVNAVNANLTGPSATIQGTTATTPPIGQAPPQVTGVKTSDPTQDSVTVCWDALTTPPDNYVVCFRESGTILWKYAGMVGSLNTRRNVSGLSPNIDYEFDVFGVTNGQRGDSSSPITFWIARREPEFSDLLMAEDGKEIDVSRIQMLFFTVIAAVFVILKVGSSHEIPEIPNGILLLMGISNGVYLTAKFIPQKR